MICSRLKSLITDCLLVIMMTAGGCFGPKVSLPPNLPPGISDAAADLMAEIDSRPHASTQKGIGRLALSDPDKGTQHLRCAFVCAYPDRIRMTLMTAGQPLETLLFDGTALIARSHTGAHRNYRKKSSDPDLNRFLGIPIPVQYLVDLFCGRTPMINAAHAAVETMEDKTILTLASTKQGMLQRLFLDSENRVYKTTFSDIKDHLVFGIQMGNFQLIEGIELPMAVHLKTRYRARIDLNVDRYQPDSELPAQAFKLPDSSG